MALRSSIMLPRPAQAAAKRPRSEATASSAGLQLKKSVRRAPSLLSLHRSLPELRLPSNSHHLCNRPDAPESRAHLRSRRHRSARTHQESSRSPSFRSTANPCPLAPAERSSELSFFRDPEAVSDLFFFTSQRPFSSDSGAEHGGSHLIDSNLRTLTSIHTAVCHSSQQTPLFPNLYTRENPEPALEDLGDNKKMMESGFIIPQAIPSRSWIKRRCAPAANRYGIRPGRQWDGVDRGNGFENQLLEGMNEKRATEREAYLWSVSDM